MAPLETIGLFGFAWTCLGPAYGVHWIAPMIFSVLIAMANVSVSTSLRVERNADQAFHSTQYTWQLLTT